MPRLRTGFSFRIAAGTIEEVMSRVKEVGWPVAPITDRCSTFGWVKWEAAAKKEGLRPVFGVELPVVQTLDIEKSSKRPAADFWTFLAQDEIEPINRLVELATQQFYHIPRLSIQQALSADGVLKIVGHRCPIDRVASEGGIYYGLSPASSRGHVRAAVDAGIPLVATCDNMFPRIGDEAFYEVVIGRNASTQSYDQHIQSDEEWLASTEKSGVALEDRKEALALRNDLWEKSMAGLRSAEIVHPPRPKPLREMCEDGAAKLGCDLSDPVYEARLNRELELIEAKQFEDYFYLVADLCQWARKRMSVGPARGSSCGSLVCYLLEITTVDPIPHGLIFERFIDLNRSDLPDIDIDFSDQQRYRLFEYMAETYGEERVARLGTVAMFKARSALQEAGGALDIPKWKLDAVADSLIERSSADSRATDTLIDTINETIPGRALRKDFPEIEIAGRLEGHPRHYSQHAAGVVVASEPIARYVAMDHRTNATMCDKNDAEGRLGLLKIDALGLTQLSVFEDCLEMAGMTMDDLQRVPIDDQAAFDVLNRGEFSGIFQWNGSALQGLTQQINVSEFNDIVAISALARPGPLATGGSRAWTSRRAGGEMKPGLHPMMDELTKETYGVVVYQEQVMRIVREMGMMSWEETSSIRKAMSKTLGDEFFAKFKAKFIEGAAENDVAPDVAAEIWDQINTFGSWAFNKSHAVAYGYISYWCCWLKAHFPFEFAAATLSHETDATRKIAMLKEMKREGFEYIPVDKDLSTEKWTAGEKDGKKYLVGPLSSVKGIGPKMVNQIISCRAMGNPLPARALKLLESPVTELDSLTPISDGIKRVCPDPSQRNIFTPPTMIGDLNMSKEAYEAMIFCTPLKINPRDENEQILVAKRDGQRIEDRPTQYLQIRVSDDSGMMLAKVNSWNFPKIGEEIINRGRPGKSLWAFKGKVFTVDDDFMVFSIKSARYLGDMENGQND